jgi:monoamine oxidase
MKRILIIGAGIAGLTAARELRRAGYDTRILEARQRIGGRTWHCDGFELGGAYVHPSQPHLWAEVTRYGLQVVRRSSMDLERVIVLSEGTSQEFDPETAYSLIEEAYSAFYAASPTPSEVFPQPYAPPDASGWQAYHPLSAVDVIDTLSLPPLQQDLLTGLLSTDMSAPLRHVALTELLRLRALLGTDDFTRIAEVSGTYVLSGGTDTLANALLEDSGSTLHTGQVVIAVEQDNTGIQVTTANGASYQADAAIVASPLNTWKNLRWTPTFSVGVRETVDAGHTGRGVKLFVQLAEQFPGTLAIAPESHPLTMLTTAEYHAQGTWLIGFGADAAALDVMSHSAVSNAVKAILPNVTVTQIRAHDWANDPFSRGTWCSLRPGQTPQLAALNGLHGRVCFASADIAYGWRGFIDGAVESGLRASRLVRGFLD